MSQPQDPLAAKIACSTCKTPLGDVRGTTIQTWVEPGQHRAFPDHDAPELRIWCRGCRRYGVLDVANVINQARRRPRARLSHPMPVKVRWIYADP